MNEFNKNLEEFRKKHIKRKLKNYINDLSFQNYKNTKNKYLLNQSVVNKCKYSNNFKNNFNFITKNDKWLRLNKSVYTKKKINLNKWIINYKLSFLNK